MMHFKKIIIGLGIYCIGGVMVDSYAEKEVILIADPKVLAVNIKDNQEAMVDLIEVNTIAYGPSPEIPNNHDYTKMRKTVYEKLKQAETLLPAGVHLCIYEAYRSLQLQKMLFDKVYNSIKQRKPDWTHQQIFVETTRLVSPVINLDGSHNIPPHSTGGAIDVYLIDNEGKALDMGIHPKDGINDKWGKLSATNSTLISDAARKNREIMGKALSAAGFINYPTEYWHWSYGERYWAYQTGKSHAIYNSYQEH